ncbi:MAG: GSCFA domain-containing protein [Bacteroidia bacterium]|nr:GSCFA domain-containing protein [Bacteroidia bacterium]
MKLQTHVEISPLVEKISHKNKILLIGSCFAENIGDKLSLAKFNINCNPFGVIYNPVSIQNSFDILEKKRLFTKEDLFFENGLWKSFYHHSKFSDIDLNCTLKTINDNIIFSHEFLKTADYVIITLGTSWIYEFTEKNIIVSNCHKTPAVNFKRRLLSIEETINSLNSIVNILKRINSNIKIIFTVSPVRHLKDGHHANTVSKSLLFTALQSIQINNENIFYFPAYEILMDELRDYRFYADDMIHPSSKAIEYIWEIFSKSYFSTETIELIKEIEDLKRAMQHKPFFKETDDYKNFKSAYFTKVCILSNKLAFLNFQQEKDFFECK